MRLFFLSIISFFLFSTVKAQGIPEIPVSLTLFGENVPLDREDVKQWLIDEMLVTQYMHSRTIKSIIYSKQYRAIIDPILKKNNIPLDFFYLCVTESNLNPLSLSQAKAAGIWQIVPGTGTQFKLEVNGSIDERYNLVKSTEVACKYLKSAFDKFGSWTMAAASYNMGMAGLTTRMEDQKEKSFYDLYLPNETMRYLYRIISYKLILQSPEKYGFNIKEKDYYKPNKYSDVVVDNALIKWVDIAKENGITYKTLKEHNPWIRSYQHTNKLGKKYVIKVLE